MTWTPAKSSSYERHRSKIYRSHPLAITAHSVALFDCGSIACLQSVSTSDYVVFDEVFDDHAHELMRQ